MLYKTAKAVQKALLSWAVYRFRLAGVEASFASLCYRPYCFFLQNRKNSISRARNDKNKLPHGIATKKSPKKELKYAKTARLKPFVSKSWFTNVNAATHGFRSGGFWFCIPPPPHHLFSPNRAHRPSYSNHLSHTNFVTHHLIHTTLPHTIFHTPALSHTNFVTHHLSHTNFHTTLSHTIFHKPTLSHIIFHTPSLSHTIFHTPTSWEAWHLATSGFLLRGRPGTWWHPPSFCVASVVLGNLHLLWWRALVARGAAPLCVAGVALGDIHLRFTWEAWRLVTSTFVSRGRRGT